MSGIYALLGLESGDVNFVNKIGADRVYEAATEYLRMVDEEMMSFYNVFIQEETEKYSERYKLPGGGRMQRRGQLAANAEVKNYGGWDVAYPLEDFEASVGYDDVTLAYTTVQDVDVAMATVDIQNTNTMRYEILRRLLNNTNTSVPAWRDIPALTVKPLANGDSDNYPPVIGTESEATENHYAGTNYTAANISDTNNPLITIRQELEEHFGTPAGFGNVAAFFNAAQIAKIEALTDYDQLDDSHKLFGANRDRVTGDFPKLPGRIVGRSNGVWVVEWSWVPANYVIGIDLDSPPPLKIRRDPVATGLPRGLHLAGQTDKHPLFASHWRNRYGIGAGNRLNGVVLQFVASTSYSVPSGF